MLQNVLSIQKQEKVVNDAGLMHVYKLEWEYLLCNINQVISFCRQDQRPAMEVLGYTVVHKGPGWGHRKIANLLKLYQINIWNLSRKDQQSFFQNMN